MSKGEEENLIPAVLSDSQDYTSRLVYADWLEEQGDSRANYLRLEIELCEAELQSEVYYSLIEKLVGHADKFDEDWLDRVGIRFDVTLLSWGKSKLEAVKVVKMFSGMSLMEAKTATESAPTVFGKSLGFAKVHEKFKQLRVQIEKPAATNMPQYGLRKSPY